MNKSKYLKIAGLLTAAGAAIVALSSGDIVTAVGVIAAAFSSSTVFTKEP